MPDLQLRGTSQGTRPSPSRATTGARVVCSMGVTVEQTESAEYLRNKEALKKVCGHNIFVDVFASLLLHAFHAQAKSHRAEPETKPEPVGKCSSILWSPAPPILSAIAPPHPPRFGGLPSFLPPPPLENAPMGSAADV